MFVVFAKAGTVMLHDTRVKYPMKTIEQILKGIRPEADFNSSANFIEDSLLDSLDIIRLISELDKKFSISIDGTDITPENVMNTEAIEKLVKKYTDSGV